MIFFLGILLFNLNIVLVLKVFILVCIKDVIVLLVVLGLEKFCW